MDPEWVDVFPIDNGDIPAMLGTTRGYIETYIFWNMYKKVVGSFEDLNARFV